VSLTEDNSKVKSADRSTYRSVTILSAGALRGAKQSYESESATRRRAADASLFGMKAPGSSRGLVSFCGRSGRGVGRFPVGELVHTAGDRVRGVTRPCLIGVLGSLVVSSQHPFDTTT